MKHKIYLRMSCFESGPEPSYRNEKEYDVIDGKCVISSGELTFDIAINEDDTANMEVEFYNPCSGDSSISQYTLKKGESQSIFHSFKGDFCIYSVKFLAFPETAQEAASEWSIQLIVDVWNDELNNIDCVEELHFLKEVLAIQGVSVSEIDDVDAISRRLKIQYDEENNLIRCVSN